MPVPVREARQCVSKVRRGFLSADLLVREFGLQAKSHLLVAAQVRSFVEDLMTTATRSFVVLLLLKIIIIIINERLDEKEKGRIGEDWDLLGEPVEEQTQHRPAAVGGFDIAKEEWVA